MSTQAAQRIQPRSENPGPVSEALAEDVKVGRLWAGYPDFPSLSFPFLQWV